MDTQRSVEDLEAAGVDSRVAKAYVKVVKDALEEHPSVDRLEKLFADLQVDLHKELSDFRQAMVEQFHGFRTQVIWVLVAALVSVVVSLIGVVANLVITFWKH